MTHVNLHPARRLIQSSNLFNDFFHDFDPTAVPKWQSPAINIRETADAIMLDLVAPGFKKEDFVLNNEKNILEVSAKQPTQSEAPKENYTRKEFALKDFTRRFQLPETVDQHAIEAHYESGILQLRLPKKIQEKPVARKIAVL